jgi:biotin carboxyl carrier protein
MPKRVHVTDGTTVWIAALEGSRVTIENVASELTIEPRGDGVFHAHGAASAAHAVVAVSGETIWVGIDGEVFEWRRVQGGARRAASRDQDALSPPMSATVVRIAVSPGQRVAAGDLLIALEAMKMELPIRAPRDGVVRAIHGREGELVQPGTQLIDLE